MLVTRLSHEDAVVGPHRYTDTDRDDPALARSQSPGSPNLRRALSLPVSGSSSRPLSRLCLLSQPRPGPARIQLSTDPQGVSRAAPLLVQWALQTPRAEHPAAIGVIREGRPTKSGSDARWRQLGLGTQLWQWGQVLAQGHVQRNISPLQMSRRHCPALPKVQPYLAAPSVPIK